MICIYRENYPGALETVEGRRLNCKAKWLRTSPENLRNAILAVEHAPYLTPPMGSLVIEIDDEIYDLELLPRDGADLLKRCRYWLFNRQRIQISTNTPRPAFGL